MVCFIRKIFLNNLFANTNTQDVTLNQEKKPNCAETELPAKDCWRKGERRKEDSFSLSFSLILLITATAVGYT